MEHSGRPTGEQAGVADRATAGHASIVPSSLARLLLGAGVAVAVVVVGALHRATVDAGGDSLARADGEWLALAGLATVAMWIAGTVSLFGVMPVRPPVGRVFAVQFAASFVNHLLPAGSGAMAVNVRFMQKHGVPRGAAVGAVGLNSLATAITHLALLAAALLIAPSALGQVRAPARRPGGPATAGPLTHGGVGVAMAVGVLGLVIALAVTARRPRRWLVRRSRAVGSAIARMVRDMRQLTTVLRHPGRAAALWLGSASLPLFHTLILFAMLRSLGVSLAIGTVLVIYVGVSALTSLLPSPGAIGGLDVALIAGLTATGASSAVAVGAVLGYRMITVWLPLLPAACTFAVVLRRRII